jgi:ATP/ADP translocase
LFQGETGRFLFLRKLFQVYPNEVKLLLWVTAIQMAMRMSSILISNYAQTTFLKRYGVEALPTMYVLEAVVTFIFATVVGVLMDRHRVIRVFTGLFLFFSLAMELLRGLLPFGYSLVYPVLFILKSQVITVLPILYWDILSDLFTTQQSKRLYTLITAGGILGVTLGSFMTARIARWVGSDNLLLVFVVGMVAAAVMNEMTEKVVGAPIEPRKDRKRKEKASLKKNLKSVSE